MTEKEIQDFFQKIQQFQKDLTAEKKLNNRCDGLKPILRPYQEEAVNWMVKREQSNNEADGKFLICVKILKNYRNTT